MQYVHIIFLIGMVTSFLVLFWVMSLVEKRFFPKRKKKKVFSDRHFHAFRQHLKRESYLRAVQMIKGFQNGLERDFRMRSRPRRGDRPATGSASAPAPRGPDVAACVALVEELFSEDAAKQFGYFVSQLAGVRESGNLADSTRFATAALECLRNELHADVAAESAAQPIAPVAANAARQDGEVPGAGRSPAPVMGAAPQERAARLPHRGSAGAFRAIGGTTRIDASAA